MSNKSFRLPSKEEIEEMTLDQYMERLGLTDDLFITLLFQPENLDAFQQEEIKKKRNKKLGALKISTRGSLIIALLEIKRCKMATDNISDKGGSNSTSSWRYRSSSALIKEKKRKNPKSLQNINFEEVDENETLEAILGNQWDIIYQEIERYLGNNSAFLMKKNQKKAWREVGNHFKGMLQRIMNRLLEKERKKAS